MNNAGNPFANFWESTPALLYGLAALLGAAYALGHTFEASVAVAAIAVPLLLGRPAPQAIARLLAAALLGSAMACWVLASYSFPPLPGNGLKGNGIVAIHAVGKQSHPFGGRWTYRGVLRSFTREGASTPLTAVKNVPVVLSIPDSENIARPPANGDYLIKGVLQQTRQGKYMLRVRVQDPWLPIEGTWSPAEWRHNLKKAAGGAIDRAYASEQNRTFLRGIATGEFDDRLMASDFSRYGLQHIMAISGFHFSIVAAFFGIVFGAFLPKRSTVVITVILLSAYFLFLGMSASIMRAWMMSVAACLGAVFERKTYGLNSLGAALLGVVAYDPLQIESLGFQFSFATTGAILLLFGPIDNLLQRLFQKRSLNQAFALPGADRHAYIALSVIRQGAALSLAVNAIALPLTLFYFHKFPVMSLIFNLFFPFMVSLAMILLLIGLCTGLFLPPLGRAAHAINEFYTQGLLNLTAYTPRAFDLSIRTEPWPAWATTAIICAVFMAGIYWKCRCSSDQEWAVV